MFSPTVKVGSTRRTVLPPKWVQVRSLRGGKKSQKKKEKEEVELAYVRANRDVAKLTFPKALQVGGHCLGLAQESGLIGLEQLAAVPFPAHRLMLLHLQASLDSLKGLLESVTTKPSEAQIVEALASWLLGVRTYQMRFLLHEGSQRSRNSKRLHL